MPQLTMQCVLGVAAHNLAWNPDPAALEFAVACADGTIRILEPSAGAETARLTGHQGPVLGLSWSPDGSELASVGADQTVRVWKRSNLTHVTLPDAAGGWQDVRTVAWSPDGQLIAAGGSHAVSSLSSLLRDEILVWSHSDRTIRQCLVVTDADVETRRLLWSTPGAPNNRLAALQRQAFSGLGITSVARIYDVSLALDIELVMTSEPIAASALDWTDAGGFLATNSGGLAATVWNAGADRPFRDIVQPVAVFAPRPGLLADPGRATAVTWHPSGTSLTVGTDSGQLIFWETTLGRHHCVVHEVPVPRRPMLGVGGVMNLALPDPLRD